MAERPSRKQLREPDEFISFTQRAIQWIIDNRKTLIVCGMMVVAAILAISGWGWYLESSAQKASSAFVKAREILEARVVPPEEEGDIPPDGTYVSEEAKYRAALESLEEAKKAHSSAATATLVTYFIGECHWKLGEHDKAVAAYEEYLRSEGPSGELAPFVIEGIAATLEDKGEYDQARQQYRRLTEEPFASQRARGLYHLARMEQKLGNEEEAVRQFKALVKEYPDTPYIREIQDRLSLLPEVEVLPEDAGDEEAPEAGKDESGKVDDDSNKAG